VTSCTIWNPQEKGKSMADMEDGGWVSQLVRPVTRHAAPLRLAGIARKIVLSRLFESRPCQLANAPQDRYICIEPGFVREFKSLKPGEEFLGQQVITVL
jgi:glucose-6-phosphate 1-epimerase